MNKFETAHKTIKKRLPKTYLIPDIRIYNTIYSMLRAEGNNRNKSYKQTCKWYADYLKKHSKNKKIDYVETKYYDHKVVRHRKGFLEITALADNPIRINLENTKYHTIQNCVFLLLHEIGHHYYRKKEDEHNERKADMFAIRWTRRFLKEGLIANKKGY